MASCQARSNVCFPCWRFVSNLSDACIRLQAHPFVAGHWSSSPGGVTGPVEPLFTCRVCFSLPCDVICVARSGVITHRAHFVLSVFLSVWLQIMTGSLRDPFSAAPNLFCFSFFMPFGLYNWLLWERSTISGGSNDEWGGGQGCSLLFALLLIIFISTVFRPVESHQWTPPTKFDLFYSNSFAIWLLLLFKFILLLIVILVSAHIWNYGKDMKKNLRNFSCLVGDNVRVVMVRVARVPVLPSPTSRYSLGSSG